MPVQLEQPTKDALSSTPRTNAAARPYSALHGDAPDYVTGSFARALERELNEALDKVIQLSIGNIDLRASLAREENARKVLASENDRLRTKLGACQAIMECNDPGNARSLFGKPQS